MVWYKTKNLASKCKFISTYFIMTSRTGYIFAFPGTDWPDPLVEKSDTDPTVQNPESKLYKIQ